MADRKAQSSTEFTVLTSFMLLIFIVFFILIQQKMVQLQEDRNLETIRQIGDIINNEINLAESTQDGYSRVFSLPITLGNDPYGVEFQQGEIIITYKDITYPLFLSIAVENYSLSPGENRISHLNDTITLVNRTSICGDNVIQKPNFDLVFEQCDGISRPPGCPSCSASCTC